MHFTTVTANPCIDRTIQVDSVNLGHSHRVQKTICDFSGKGINVSLALTQLGMPVKSVCLSHSDGEAADFFKQRDMDAELIPVPGNVRINIKLFETSTGCMTEFNERHSSTSRNCRGCYSRCQKCSAHNIGADPRRQCATGLS